MESYDNDEIATLQLVARNDRKKIPVVTEGKGIGKVVLKYQDLVYEDNT
ncbi:MAG: hypothetical protein AB1606_05695 [Nitrospirota bacterium]